MQRNRVIISTIFIFVFQVFVSNALLGQDDFQIANTHYKKKNYDKALVHYKKALKTVIEKGGQGSEKYAALYANIGACYLLQYDFDRSLEYVKKSLSVYKKLFGEDHKKTKEIKNFVDGVKKRKNNPKHHYILGLGSYENAKYEKALKHLLIAKRLYERKLGTRSKKVASCFVHIGNSQYALKRYSNAADNYLRAIQIMSRLPKKEQKNLIDIREVIAKCYFKKKNYRYAVVTFHEILKVFKKTYGEKHIETGRTHYMLGTFYALYRIPSKAKLHLKTALRIAKKHNNSKLIRECKENLRRVR